MSYRSLGESSVGPDTATTVPEAIIRRRGWVAIPTADMREYSKAQLVTAGSGFFVGVLVGAALGNIFAGRTPLTRNRSRRRR